MKKLFVAAVAVAMAFGSCQKSAGPSASLKTDLDTLSYELGMLNSQGLKEYLVSRKNVDTTYMDDFFKGLAVAAQSGDDKRKAAYFSGIEIGRQLGVDMFNNINYSVFGSDSSKTISLRNLLAGFIAATKGKGTAIDLKVAQDEIQQRMETYRNKQLEVTYGANKEAGEKFLAENKEKEGVKTTASGLQYKVLKEGTGPIPADTSVVLVNYEGRLIDGTVFDSSYKNNDGKPNELTVNRMIPGWIEALTMMPEGSEWEIYIPQELAYGTREAGDKIKPFSTLIFKLKLEKVNK